MKLMFDTYYIPYILGMKLHILSDTYYFLKGHLKKTPISKKHSSMTVTQAATSSPKVESAATPSTPVSALNDVDTDSPCFQLSSLSLQLLANDLITSGKQQQLQQQQQQRDSIDSLPLPTMTNPDHERRVSESLFSSLLLPVTDEMYQSLDLYLTTQITLAYLNDVVGEINDLITDKRQVVCA